MKTSLVNLSFLFMVSVLASCSSVQSPSREVANDVKGGDAGEVENLANKDSDPEFPNCKDSLCLNDRVFVRWGTSLSTQSGILTLIRPGDGGRWRGRVNSSNGQSAYFYIDDLEKFSNLEKTCYKDKITTICLKDQVGVGFDPEEAANFRSGRPLYYTADEATGVGFHPQASLLGFSPDGALKIKTKLSGIKVDKNAVKFFATGFDEDADKFYYGPYVYHVKDGDCDSDDELCVGKKYDNKLGAQDKVLAIMIGQPKDDQSSHYVVLAPEFKKPSYVRDEKVRFFLHDNYMNRLHGIYQAMYYDSSEGSIVQNSLTESNESLREEIKSKTMNYAKDYCEKKFDGFGTIDEEETSPFPEIDESSCEHRTELFKKTTISLFPEFKPKRYYDCKFAQTWHVTCTHKLLQKK